MKHVLPLVSLAGLLCGCAGYAGGEGAARSEKRGVSASEAHDARMGWWREARFGMFIHWGVYAVPAGTWNGKTTSGPSEWLMQSLKVPTSQYEGFAQGFTAANYDPAQWASLARRAGMKYVVITSRHHDGFCLWDSATTEWDVKAAPAGRDLLAPLAEATRKEGLKFCTYYSIKDWRHPDYEPARAWNDNPKWNGGPGYKRDFDGRFVPYVHAQVEEVIRRYQPSVMWFDGEWEDTWTESHGDALMAHVRGLKPDIIVNNRVGKSRNDMQGMTKPGVKAQGDFCTPEQEIPATGFPGIDWETCMTMNTSWGIKAGDNRWKSADEMVRMLCDIASKGGNFLMNVGPTADGRIPQESVERLEAVGRWMGLNGAGIYGTRASPFRRLGWGRCTAGGEGEGAANRLNLFVYDWPQEGRLVLPGLKNRVKSARVVSMDKMLRRVEWASRADGVALSNLGPRPGGLALSAGMPVLVIVDLEGAPVVDNARMPVTAGADGSLVLTAGEAEIVGQALRLQTQGGVEDLAHWTDPKDKAVWSVSGLRPGQYVVELDLACIPGDAGSPYRVTVGDGSIDSTVPATGSWGTFRTVRLAGLQVKSATPARVEVAPTDRLKGGLMNLRTVRIIPDSSTR